MAFGYPIALDVSGRTAVVAGADAVAHGKVEALLEAGALVRVVAPGPPQTLSRLEADPRVAVHRRPYEPGDLEGAFLCVAASEDPDVREAIFAEARWRGVLLNVMDDPPHCDFAAPAIVRRGELAIAVSTGGRSPALARYLRIRLARQFGPEWGELLDLLGRVREETLSHLPDVADRARRWRRALDVDDLLQGIRAGRTEEARRRLVARLLGDEAGAA